MRQMHFYWFFLDFAAYALHKLYPLHIPTPLSFSQIFLILNQKLYCTLHTPSSFHLFTWPVLMEIRLAFSTSVFVPKQSQHNVKPWQPWSQDIWSTVCSSSPTYTALMNIMQTREICFVKEPTLHIAHADHMQLISSWLASNNHFNKS